MAVIRFLATKYKLPHPESLLDSLPGLCWITDRRGVIISIGMANWRSFAERNNAPELLPEKVIGTSLNSYISGEAVRRFYKRLLDAALQDGRRRFYFEYRCDAPDARRDMSMSISPLSERGEVTGLMFQSQLHAHSARPRIELFTAAARGPMEGYQTLHMCSSCHDVKHEDPVTGAWAWITPSKYYYRGGTDDVNIEHDICPKCAAKAVAPGGQQVSKTEKPYVIVCSACKDVLWQTNPDVWVSPTRYYQLGGDEDRPVAHGICPRCKAKYAED